jgi:hypothetical protein
MRWALAAALLACSCANQRWVRSELYFGSARAGLSPVAAGEWQRFVDEEIAARFPQGFTVLPARGHWLGDAGALEEESHILVVLWPAELDSGKRLDELRALYRVRFNQDSVLRVDQPVSASFGDSR